MKNTSVIIKSFFLLFYLLIIPNFLAAQIAGVDPTFNTIDQGYGFGNGPDGAVFTSAFQNDGKIIIGGQFYNCDGQPRNRIARLNSDGTLDTTFNIGTGFNVNVHAIAIQVDGKIIVGGEFGNFNGMLRNRIARLNTDGSLDTTFNPGNGFDEMVYDIKIQNDGKIIIGGRFFYFNGTSVGKLCRLNSNGTLDTTFNIGSGISGTFVRAVSIQSDGKILVGGFIDFFNFQPIPRIIRLNIDGTLDTTFNNGGSSTSSADVNTICIQSDGKILIGGRFDVYNGIPRSKIARLNIDGTLDVSFNPGSGFVGTFSNSTNVASITIQSDGKIVVLGEFTEYDNNVGINNITRLNQNGSLDLTFNHSVIFYTVKTVLIQNDGKLLVDGTVRLFDDGEYDCSYRPNTGFNGTALSICTQNDGKIIVGGSYQKYNGACNNNIVRLEPSGNLDPNFASYNLNSINGAINYTSVQSDGKIIVNGFFTEFNTIPSLWIVRLNSNGTLDTSFSSGANSIIYTHAIQNDGKIIIGGGFTSYDGTISNCIARLNTDGSLDASLDAGTGADGYIKATAIQADGKIVIGGYFSNYNGFLRNNIARINSNGTLDATFNVGVGTNSNGEVSSICIQDDGKIILAGTFTSYNGIARNRIVRLNTNGTIDLSFDPGAGANNEIKTIAIQNNNQIIIGGLFTQYNGNTCNYLARLNSDGTLDSIFNTSIGANNSVWASAIQSDGKVLIGGNFTSCNNIGKNRIARLFSDSINLLTAIKPQSNFGKSTIVYPIPSTGKFTIKNENLTGKKLTLYNSLGQVICNMIVKSNVYELDISDAAKGVYILKITSANQENDDIFLKKIIKN